MSVNTHPTQVLSCVVPAGPKLVGLHVSHEDGWKGNMKQRRKDLSATCRYDSSYVLLLFGSVFTQMWTQAACPPREVRSFRVLLMRDACATRRPARRIVELTVWDVLELGFDGAPAGHFKEGRGFQVSGACV